MLALAPSFACTRYVDAVTPAVDASPSDDEEVLEKPDATSAPADAPPADGPEVNEPRLPRLVTSFGKGGMYETPAARDKQTFVDFISLPDGGSALMLESACAVWITNAQGAQEGRYREPTCRGRALLWHPARRILVSAGLTERMGLVRALDRTGATTTLIADSPFFEIPLDDITAMGLSNAGPVVAGYKGSTKNPGNLDATLFVLQEARGDTAGATTDLTLSDYVLWIDQPGTGDIEAIGVGLGESSVVPPLFFTLAMSNDGKIATVDQREGSELLGSLPVRLKVAPDRTRYALASVPPTTKTASPSWAIFAFFERGKINSTFGNGGLAPLPHADVRWTDFIVRDRDIVLVGTNDASPVTTWMTALDLATGLPVGPFETEGALPVQEGVAALRIAPAGDGAVLIAGLTGVAANAAFVAKVQLDEPKP